MKLVSNFFLQAGTAVLDFNQPVYLAYHYKKQGSKDNLDMSVQRFEVILIVRVFLLNAPLL